MITLVMMSGVILWVPHQCQRSFITPCHSSFVLAAGHRCTCRWSSLLVSHHRQWLCSWYLEQAKNPPMHIPVMCWSSTFEQLRQQAQRVWWATKKYQAGGLPGVKVKEQGRQKNLHRKEWYWEGLWRQKSALVSRSYGHCPFLEEPLLSEFGILGNDNAANITAGNVSTTWGCPKMDGQIYRCPVHPSWS